MKRIFALTVVVTSTLAVAAAWAQTTKPAAATAPAATKPAGAAAAAGLTVKQQASYGLGLSMGRNFTAQGVELDPEMLIKGLSTGLTGGQSLLTDEQIELALQAFQEELIQKQTAKAQAMAAENKKAGDAYLAENGKKTGVKSTASGLQYKVVKEGAGVVPKETDVVKVHYKGSLLDGTVFDSSYERNEPAIFPVNGVIKGWVEALQLMKVGSSWQIAVPSDLAYGTQPPPNSGIGPNSVLLFDVELLGIEAPAADASKVEAKK